VRLGKALQDTPNHARRGRRERNQRYWSKKKQLVNFRVRLMAQRLFRQFSHNLGMKIKRFQTNFMKIDLLVAEINRSTFSISVKNWPQCLFSDQNKDFDVATVGIYLVNVAV